MSSFLNSYSFVGIFLAVVLGYWGIGMFFGLPYIFWWYDVIAHFLGGAWTMSFIFFLKNKLRVGPANIAPITVFIVMIGIVSLVGVLWEFLEYAFDRYIIFSGFTYLPGIYEDTIFDLFLDLLGGAAMYLIL